jgi:hypothetical protein
MNGQSAFILFLFLFFKSGYIFISSGTIKVNFEKTRFTNERVLGIIRGVSMKFILITNNAMVNERYKDLSIRKLQKIVFDEKLEFLDVLKMVRDYIHLGHQLLTHPLTGSVKPYETPFKSIAISSEKGEVDMSSVKIIEDSIATTEKFMKDYKKIEYSERVYDDFRLVDYTLIESGIESITQFS